MITLQLPYPPSVNHYWRHVGPRTLISRHGRRFRQDVEELVRRDIGIQGKVPLEGHLVVDILLYPPDRRRRDLDNTLKALLDALQHAGVYRDDHAIVELTVERREIVRGGTAVVRIRTRDDLDCLPGYAKD